MTKFSVLVPTRNRVEYLRQAVESVLCQDYTDWEICIADNVSSDSTREWVEGLDDPRILYSRAERLIPVTDNWNRVLSMSSGDYVVMLGDDDAILRGYFTSHKQVIDEFGEPETRSTPRACSIPTQASSRGARRDRSKPAVWLRS